MYTTACNQREYGLSTLRTIYVSGSVLDDKTYMNAHAVFSPIPIYNVYGLSELGPRVSAQTVNCCKSNSVGKPLNGIDIRIITERGAVALNGECGVIHVNTPCQFRGYITGEQKHKSLFNGWYNTGDIGYIDEFEELHIVCRLDDVIIIDSHKVYPGDIERQILKYAKVKECIVVGMGSYIGCLYTNDKEIDKSAVNRALKRVLLPYEIPKVFIKSDYIPKNRNGKNAICEINSLIEKWINSGEV
jgi:acyl-coenzyme A synthetase/AMP-(fatty) acid ligase